MTTKTRRQRPGALPGAGTARSAPGARRAAGAVVRAAGPSVGASRAVASRRLLDAARRALGVASDGAAIRTALEAVVARERQAQGILRLPTLGPVDASRVD